MPPFWQGLNSLKLVDGQHEVAFGDLQPRLERAGVREVVHVDLGGPRHGLHRLRLVVHVIPAGGIVEAADHVDAVRGEDEMPVVEIVLFGRVHRDRRARLLARVRGLLCS